MEPEKNRIKVSKYRTRKGLKEAGYEKADIDEIIANVDWAISSPATVLAQYAGQSSMQTASPQEETEGSAPWGWIAGAIILGGAFILGIAHAIRRDM